MIRFLIVLVSGIFLFSLTIVSATPFIIGIVNNSLDGTQADGHTMMLWNPSMGLSDNVTDVIGPSGNSGASNIFMIDCDLLSNGCSVGINISLKVINNGDDYVTPSISHTITGEGVQMAEEIQLNSPPNITSLQSPLNYANLSIQTVSFICNASDIDSNLESVTLYGDWGISGWHANKTNSATGNVSTAQFNDTLSEGLYTWSCLVTDTLQISKIHEPQTIVIDLTSPIISSFSHNFSSRNHDSFKLIFFIIKCYIYKSCPN